jgi:hypothetical protein
MSSEKRRRKKENRRAKAELSSQPVPELSDLDLDLLLVDVTVRADCDHASTRTSADGLVLIRCAVAADVAGGCPHDCPKFDRRRVGGLGL